MVFDAFMQDLSTATQLPPDFLGVILGLRIAIIFLIAVDMYNRQTLSKMQQIVLMAGVVILPIVGPVIYIFTVLTKEAQDAIEEEQMILEAIEEERRKAAMEDEEFVCDECGESFETRRGLHIHQGQKH